MMATTMMMAHDDNGNRSGGFDGENNDGDGDQDHGEEEE